MFSLTRRALLAASAATAATFAVAPLMASAAPRAMPLDVLAARRPTVPRNVVYLTDFCRGDGVTDDTRGFQAALDRLGSMGGGTLIVPASPFLLAPRNWITVPSRVAIAGAGPNSKLLIRSDRPDSYTLGLRIVGDDVSIDDVTFERVNNVYGSFIGLLGSRFWMKGVRMQGNMSRWMNDFNGIFITPNGGLVDGATIRDSLITECGYGVYMSEAEGSSLRDIYFYNFTGLRNHCDDIELPAPRGRVENVVVQECRFMENLSKSIGAGMAVGLANAHGVRIAQSYFDGYPMNSIHLERYCSDVSIEDNSFVRCSTFETGLGYASAVFIISGTKDVTILRNSFDLTHQTNEVHAVYVGPGGPGEHDPSGIRIQGNSLAAKSMSSLFVNYGRGGVSSGENRMVA